MKAGALVLALALQALAGCDRADMAAQPRAKTWDENAFFADTSTMRHPVPGTVPRNPPHPVAAKPATITAAMLTRGHERYDIFCSPCHGRSGDGRGMIVERGFPRPPSFHDTALRQAPAELIYDAVTKGHGAMFSYADRVSPADRWAVTAYIRALQLSQSAPVALLTDEDRAKLGGSP